MRPAARSRNRSQAARAWRRIGIADWSRQVYADAIVALRRAVALAPRDTTSRFYLGRALFHMGQVDAAIDELLRASESGPMRREALRHLAVIIPLSPSRGHRAILDIRRRWADVEERRESPVIVTGGRKSSGSTRIRIGYFGSFFHHRNWMKPVWGVVNHHDRSRFAIHLLADKGEPTAENGYHAHPSDRVHRMTGLTNVEAARRIARMNLDVLVDLNGYSASSRLGVFMHRPARAIVAWFNAFATTGIRAFDYIIGDAEVVRPSEERWYAEQVLRVSGTYLAFSVLYPVPDVTLPPCARNGYITFGCLAPQYKITPQVIAAWGRILKGAPDAKLLLKSTCLGHAANRVALFERLASHGIPADRVRLEGPEEHHSFLATYARIDIALDTFPYTGGTTTMEALWQGVPVLTFAGNRWISRIGASIVTAAGLTAWTEPSREAYIERAIALATSPRTCSTLSRMRKTLRARLKKSAACDSPALCRELEDHYRRIAGVHKDD